MAIGFAAVDDGLPLESLRETAAMCFSLPEAAGVARTF